MQFGSATRPRRARRRDRIGRHRPRRRQRRRQDDPDEHPARAARADRRARRRVLGLDPATPGCRAARRRRLRARTQRVPGRHAGIRFRQAPGGGAWHAQATRPRVGRATRCGSSGSARSGSARSAPCRPASASGSSSPRRSRPTRRSCFLDEPTDGLDPVQRDEMLALIRQISAEYAIDVMLSSHLLEEVERICDHVVALDAGTAGRARSARRPRRQRRGCRGRTRRRSPTGPARSTEVAAALDRLVASRSARGRVDRADGGDRQRRRRCRRLGARRDRRRRCPRAAESSGVAADSKISSTRPGSQPMSDARFSTAATASSTVSAPVSAGAVRSVAWHTIRSILGLGRSARHKVFPIIVCVIAFLPAIVFIAVTILFGDFGDELRPEYWEFFGFSFMRGDRSSPRSSRRRRSCATGATACSRSTCRRR